MIRTVTLADPGFDEIDIDMACAAFERTVERIMAGNWQKGTDPHADSWTWTDYFPKTGKVTVYLAEYEMQIEGKLKGESAVLRARAA